MQIPLFTSDWRRSTAEEPSLKVQNRYFESNPSNQVDGVAVLSRPGFRKFDTVGEDESLTVSSVHSMYSQEGLFNESLFVITDDYVFAGAPTPDGVPIAGVNYDYTSLTPYSNRGCFTGGIGDVPAYFFFLGEQELLVYPEEEFAQGVLTASAQPEENATVIIGGIYYRYVSGSVDAGTPAGTSANPWLVQRTADTLGDMTNLWRAINLKGTPGLHYSSLTSRHPTVTAEDFTPTTVSIYAQAGGESGNDIATTVSGTANLSWGSATLQDGGGFADRAFKVPLPDEIGDIKAITTFFSHVILVVDEREVSSDPEIIGRFYWIEPGETAVDSLNFATAESVPDALVSARVINDRLWLLGTNSVEVWYYTGNADAPFARTQGNSFSIGCLEGSDCIVKDSLFFIGPDNHIYQFTGSSYNVVSDNSVSERIRSFQDDTFVGTYSNLIRTWTFDLDGHTFYVINLGLEETIVYEVLSKQFMTWGNGTGPFLTQHAGHLYTNTSGKRKRLVGDISSGTLWEIDPTYRIDDNSDDDLATAFQCTVTGGLPMRMRETAPCFQVYVTASLGSPVLQGLVFIVDEDTAYFLTDEDGYFLVEGVPSFEGANPNTIKLETSDDSGHTWVDHGEIEINSDDFTQELAWRSLGLIVAPGRLFRLTDYNTVVRIDGLDIASNG